MHNNGISIKVKGEFLDLKRTTRIQATFNNPIFNNELIEGNFSLPFTIPWTPKNRRLFGFIEIVASTKVFYTEEVCEVFLQVTLFYTGTIRVKKTRTGDYFATLLITAPDLRFKMENNSLVDLDLGGDRQITGNLTVYRAALKAITTGTFKTFDFVLFPVFNPIAISTIDFPFYASFINQYRSNQFNKSATGGFFNEPKCPYPYVIYLFNRVLAQEGYTLSGSFFDDREIQTLVVYNNYLEDDGNLELNFNLTNHVPDISQADYFIRLKKKFNLGYFFNHDTKDLEVVALKDILSSQKSDDWTDRVGPDEEVSQEKAVTYLLKYDHDGTDGVSPGRFKSLEGLTIVDPVEKFADLPLATQQMGDNNEARLVRSINQYWFVLLEPPFLPSWKYYSDNLYDFQVGQDEGQNIVIDANISTLLQDRKTNQISFELQLVPNIYQLCSTEFGEKEKEPFGFSILFYRGIHKSDIANKDYPMGSYHNYNLQEDVIAAYSLKMSGSDGIYETWWRPWLEFLIGKKTIKRQILLGISELKSYANGGDAWKTKTRIDDVEYIRKQVTVGITMDGIESADVTLYSIPFTPSEPVPAGTITTDGAGPSERTPGPPRNVDEAQAYSQGLGPIDPAEGFRLGAGTVKGSKFTGFDIKQQVRAIFRFDEYVNEEFFVFDNINFTEDEFEITDHQFRNGDTMSFTDLAGLPGGIVEGVVYYVVETGQGSDLFKVSATRGGAPIDISIPAGGIDGTVKSNVLGDISLRTFIPANATIQRTYLENLVFNGEGPPPPRPSGNARVSFFLEDPEDLLAETFQRNIFPVGPQNVFVIDGKQSGGVSDFMKTTAEKEVIMRVENLELENDDYALVIEYATNI